MSVSGQESRHGRLGIRWSTTAGPTVEPITLADVRSHRRLDSDDTTQDVLIALLIQMAREYAESFTGLGFISQQRRMTLDGFPGIILPLAPFAGVAAWLPTPQPSPEIGVQYGPLMSVDSITYLDAVGTLQTLAPTVYTVDKSGIFPRISLAYGQQWPDTLPQIGSVAINVTLGFGTTAAQVPAGIRHWLLMRVGTAFENREEVAILNRGKVEALPFVDGLLDPYKQPVI